ncbi:UDP-N-acetylmuramate--L-alanine ligase [Anaerotignum sp.]|uniref:UDP-N-acetylmuramate--L-alanine ligase n=1 Tax=Anaerotignum sp. TaxID=2039241 RepID=UPI00332F9D08
MTTIFQNSDHIYFIGIGGISMSGLAEILASRGYKVSGTDIRETPVTNHLQSVGIHINIGHKAENITNDITHVVFTAAIHDGNPELEAAKAKGLIIMDRAQLLGQIMGEHSNSVAVSGTHGKTTTTSMVSEILLAAEKDPTITVGGILPTIGSNLKIGKSPFFVAEACEYYNSFLRLNPLVGIILNIESDHLDFFGSLENIYHSFHEFAKRIPENGVLVINKEIPSVSEIAEGLVCRVETFSLNADANWTAKNILHHEDGKSTFDVYYNDNKMTTIHLNVPGDHNISNALAAVASAHYLGISSEDWVKGLNHFAGTDRRFQRKGEKNGVLVIDDYAHHPTEIRATLAAAKKVKHNTTWCVFQPHTYSRTKFLFEDFGDAFFNADEIIIADIYAAREIDDGTVSAEQLAQRIAKTGKSGHYVGNFDEILAYLENHCQPGDLLLTVGAGDVYKIGEAFLAQ